MSIFGNGEVYFLMGLAAAKVEGAQELIDIISKYGDVELNEEY